MVQDDLLNGHLTVEETLGYAARLRLYAMSQEERTQRVEDVINFCNLGKCRQVYIPKKQSGVVC